MLDVVSRSQRGRICDYTVEGKVIRTPAVIGTDSDVIGIRSGPEGRILVFNGKEFPLDPKLLTSVSSGIAVPPVCHGKICILRLPFPEDIVIPKEAEIVIVPNAFELRKDARRLVDAVISVREVAGNGRLVCMLGIAEPSTLALLSYMGVDLFDDSLVTVAGKAGLLLIPEGEVQSEGDVSAENREEMIRECSKIMRFTEAERLRELVDQRAPSSPSSVAVLRIFDEKGFAYQEEQCSTVGCRFACNTTQALRRPDLVRYRERILSDYKKPEHKRILLLLPCSAKKPYHISKTHKMFASAIHTAPHDTLVHEVIITSPLGIVPRELDVLYPANSYDIPVTGQWKCEEKRMIREMLSHLLEQGYDKVICHLGEDYELVEGLAEMECTVVGDSTTPASLENLDSALRKAAKGMEPVDYAIERKESIKSLLGFQFGSEVASAIMDENTFGIGRFPYWKIIREDPADRKNKIQLGMLTAERGMVSLTIEGAQILADMDHNRVEMTDFEMKGNLFAVGVVSADHRIRIGDEAVITLNGKVKGVGVAMMSGREMEELSRGIAVKVRHKSG